MRTKSIAQILLLFLSFMHLATAHEDKLIRLEKLKELKAKIDLTTQDLGEQTPKLKEILSHIVLLKEEILLGENEWENLLSYQVQLLDVQKKMLSIQGQLKEHYNLYTNRLELALKHEQDERITPLLKKWHTKATQKKAQLDALYAQTKKEITSTQSDIKTSTSQRLR